MLALLSRFFLQDVSLCLVWLEEGGDEEELVLARESSSDIPVWIGEEPEPAANKTKAELEKGGAPLQFSLTSADANLSSKSPDKSVFFLNNIFQ